MRSLVELVLTFNPACASDLEKGLHRSSVQFCVVVVVVRITQEARICCSRLRFFAMMNFQMRFHHIQCFVDDVRPLEHYKALEAKFNTFSKSLAQAGLKVKTNSTKDLIAQGKKLWNSTMGAAEDEKSPAYNPVGQDFVEQLIAGMGWRITGTRYNAAKEGTNSVLISPPDSNGASFVVTALSSGDRAASGGSPKEGEAKKDVVEYKCYCSERVNLFYDSHAGRQGIAVLAFELSSGDLENVYANYRAKHPGLLVTPEIVEFEEGRLFEVYAYYLKGDGSENKQADRGTTLRFLASKNPEMGKEKVHLPGITSVEAEYVDGMPAYSDHWVSNVFDRQQFLDTLKDALGFTPKVDFNAGVVAAGEAQIESTVTGNASQFRSASVDEALLDQSQIYLPTNNALSEAGHVYLFLQEMGQGVQHLASRVDDLVSFIQQTNNYRLMTNQGFSFLRIPRSYYGRLTVAEMNNAGLSDQLAEAIMASLLAARLMDKNGIVSLDIADEEIVKLKDSMSSNLADEFTSKLEQVQLTVKRSRYINMHKLLRDLLSEETYLQIVRNQILVDIQAGDILYQIFTANILQRAAGDEAPFLEFIQRVCKPKTDVHGNPVPLRAGCGGFGIRNFLTLFLSIEVSKAMLEYEKSIEADDMKSAELAQKKVDTFSSQLEESNPILTAIAEAMTAEADALDSLVLADTPVKEAEIRSRIEHHRQEKEDGQKRLMDLSKRYQTYMRELRQAK
eukprot:TRINITY_DN13235_c0_g1_i1.p1 TRINITY_DN13235_c0_g1~~TRINITY_DN13235_c0_g1_i1.p1  ORF type:complete len:733 (-),score=262.88 TRINITY_DN13235_c0_g1_i1:66-2264(-)